MSRTEALEAELATDPGKVVVAGSNDSERHVALELPPSFLAPPVLGRSKVQLADRLNGDHQLVPNQERTVALGQREATGSESRRKDACIDDDRTASARFGHSSTARRKDSASSGVRSSIARSSMERRG